MEKGNDSMQTERDEIDRIFERYTRAGAPGCAVGVMLGGELVLSRGYGLADLEQGLPMTPATALNIGSLSKQFTAFGIALLEAEGRLALDDDVRRHLPELPDLGATITLRHLLHHTSGLRGSFPELLALAGWRMGDVTTTDDVFGLLQAQRELNFRPGDEFLYVNSNYVLLALVCERAAGRPFAEFCCQRIFRPLGMARTAVNDDIHQLIPGRAPGYYRARGGRWQHAPLANSVVGSTNVYSTVEDLARWDENFYTGRVGGLAIIRHMHETGRLNDGRDLQYAFGLELGPAHTHLGWGLVEHGGNHGGYSSWLLRIPAMHLGVVVLLNSFLAETRDLALRVAEHALPALAASAPPAAEPPSVALPAETLAALVGTYFDPQRAALRRVTGENGRLYYEGHELVALGERHFAIAGDRQVELRFPAGAVETHTPDGDYSYRRVPPYTPDTGALAEYVGRYESVELDVRWTISAADNCLRIGRKRHPDTEATPVLADAFRDDWRPVVGYPLSFLLHFERDAQGAVIGLRVSGARVRHLRFVRV